MAHLLKHQGRPEPGVWRAADSERLNDWRTKAHRNLQNREGRIVTFEDRTAHHADWEYVDRDQYGNPVMEVAKAEKPEESRTVVDLNTRDLIDQMLVWAKHQPELFRKKIALMKQSSGMTHLTDDEAAERVHDLCRKIAEDDTQRVFKGRGLTEGLKGAVLLG